MESIYNPSIEDSKIEWLIEWFPTPRLSRTRIGRCNRTTISREARK
ncbi:MAG: hypothetical protein ACO2O2_09860 [Acidilobaceae archaeon]